MLKESLERLIRHEDLTEAEMVGVMNLIMEGEATPAQIGGILTALRLKGETVDEITGAARVMRQKSLKVNYSAPIVIDTCGTGGDGANTFNISTTAAFIVSAAGIPVAKHGNRAMSSKCGSADLLEALGLRIDLAPEQIEKCLKVMGIGFMFAPVFHQSMKYAVGPRRELGFRTIFNMLGPLTNPASVNCQLIGVYKPELTRVLAEVLQQLNVKRAMVVHGAGGLDELSLEGPNDVSFLTDHQIIDFTISAEDAGLPSAPNCLLMGGTATENAVLTEGILSGSITGPQRDVVLLNAAAAFFVADKVADIKDGVILAAQLIDSGAAAVKLQELRRISL